MFSVISKIAMRQLLFHITIFIFILGIFQVIDAIKNVTFYDLPVAALFLLSTPQAMPRAPRQFVPVVQCMGVPAKKKTSISQGR